MCFWLKENKVTEVAISANQIQGKIKENATGKEQMFRTVRVDSDTSKLLEQYNVKFKGEIESRFLPTLLSWIVPVFLFIGVILLAATNRPEILDPALLRPGRFDRNILVDRPDKKGREEILKVHLKNIKVSEDVDLSVLAGMTPGMVGADLANLINEAALLAVRRNKKKAGMPEFEEAVERVVAGLEKKNRLINPREREIVAYHEMGHALVAISLPGTDPVQKISIIPRGIAALGYTMQTPTEDRFLMNKSELLNRIATLLGGRAAEDIVFEDIST
jgi:cell division protease FtsH